jgi:putative ABC transport system substrate-binding protein
VIHVAPQLSALHILEQHMRRRDFIALIGGAAVSWPLAARVEQPALPVVGFLGGDAVNWAPWTNAFAQRMRELGWAENRTVAVEYRWVEGRPERYTEIAPEFVQLKAKAIVTSDRGALSIRDTTSAIPIVFVLASDPVGQGLVESLARPGRNVTGIAADATDASGKRVLNGKRIELLREIVPTLRRLGIMVNVTNPDADRAIQEAREGANAVGIEATTFPIRRAEDIAPAFEALKGQVDALFVVQDAVLTANRMRLTALSLAARLRTVFRSREYVQAGGLLSYGPSFPAFFRRAADYVDKILRGTKPGDIPVEQPTKFNLIVNLTTAKMLGLTVPPTLLATADEVIE